MIQESVYWLKASERIPSVELKGSVRCDALVIGGGITGLRVAERMLAGGLRTVLLESSFCGSGATGRSSGFVTPDTELGLRDLLARYGEVDASILLTHARAAVRRISRTIERHNLKCDYLPSESFYVAAKADHVSSIEEEHQAHRQLAVDSTFVSRPDLRHYLATDSYHAALWTDGSFSINGYRYCLGLKRALEKAGLIVFEDSRAVEIKPGCARTEGGTVEAQTIFICSDRLAPESGLETGRSFFTHTLLALTEPLDPACLKEMFPAGPLLVWDSNFIYNYFRPTIDNRLLIGGNSLPGAYSILPRRTSLRSGAERLAGRLAQKFRMLRNVRVSHAWGGSFGVSFDMLPIAGQAASSDELYWAVCGGGLPWSMMAADTVSDLALHGRNELSGYFSPNKPSRRLRGLKILQSCMGRPLTFAFSHLLIKTIGR